jgi:hypothetical protein
MVVLPVPHMSTASRPMPRRVTLATIASMAPLRRRSKPTETDNMAARLQPRRQPHLSMLLLRMVTTSCIKDMKVR